MKKLFIAVAAWFAFLPSSTFAQQAPTSSTPGIIGYLGYTNVVHATFHEAAQEWLDDRYNAPGGTCGGTCTLGSVFWEAQNHYWGVYIWLPNPQKILAMDR